MPKVFNLSNFNKLLKESGQTIYAIEITASRILLSNGLELLTIDEIRKCKRRVMTGNIAWRDNFDNLYSLDSVVRATTETQIKNSLSSKGGKSSWQMNKDKMLENLNNGTPWNKGMKGKYPYSYKLSDETKQKISAANTGENNGMYGVKMPDEEKQRRSKLVKEKILSGQFTPNSNNRNTHWDSFYNGKKYRSSWEALYQYFDQDAKYESLRIPYIFDDIDFVYIIDFINHYTRTVIEVKPAELLTERKTIEKIKYAKEWCQKNRYEFIIADREFFIKKGKPTTFDLFDDKTANKIKKIYEIN